MSLKLKQFETIRELVKNLPEANLEMVDKIHQDLANFKGPENPLGKTMQAIEWLASWQGAKFPSLSNPVLNVYIASHSIAQSLFDKNPVDGAKNRIEMLKKGQAPAAQVALVNQIKLRVFELDIEHPSHDFRTGNALSEKECLAAITYGMEAVVESPDIIILGDAGYGSAAAAACVVRGLYGGTAEYWAGGQHEMGKNRIEAVKQGIDFHREFLEDPLDILMRFGGRDISALFGAILAARLNRTPVILDGFITCAAAAVLYKLNHKALEHCYIGHKTSEPAHAALLDRIGKEALLSLEIGIGDGFGAAVAFSVIRSASEAFSKLGNY